MWFVLAAIVFMFVGRKLGWWLSRVFFYQSNFVFAVIGVALWGVVVAIGVSWLIEWQHPGTILKWIFGFALGAYVAIPNYGLFSQGTIPPEGQLRHNVVSNLPFVTYVFAEISARWGPRLYS